MSICSMTGYARAEGRDGQTSWVWEGKSVNGRGLEVRCRVPYGHDGLDVAAKDAAAKVLKRGNLQISLTVSRQADDAPVRVNRALLDQLAALVAELAPSHPTIAAARWDGLLSVKGVIESSDAGADTAQDPQVQAQRDQAMRADLALMLDNLAVMRAQEGQRIGQVLSDQLDEIQHLAGQAGQVAALRPDAVRQRLQTQIAALTDQVPALSEERLMQELALLAVKADVREELDRLAAHIQAARHMLAQGGAVGRKLDFLTQEFNREANTLCSKSQDVDLTRIGLDLKAVIDQFREQVQNIE